MWNTNVHKFPGENENRYQRQPSPEDTWSDWLKAHEGPDLKQCVWFFEKTVKHLGWGGEYLNSSLHIPPNKTSYEIKRFVYEKITPKY